MEEKDNESMLEAVLFLAGRYLTLQELVMFTNINPIMLRELLDKLQKKYAEHSAFEIVFKNDKYKMDVRPKYAHLVNKIATGQTEFTKAEQETLAIIAYKQPITQAIVVKIRGNKAYDHIKHLIEVGLVKAKRVKHTLELILDESFYNYFSVQKKQEEKIEENIDETEEEKAVEVLPEPSKEVEEEIAKEEKEEINTEQDNTGQGQ